VVEYAREENDMADGTQTEGAELQVEGAYFVGTHRYSWRAGRPLKIVGVYVVTPPGQSPRPCFAVMAGDGSVDYTPIDEKGTFELISESDLTTGRIPAVVN